MCADFRFHPVGHGLFYSGVINLQAVSGNPFTFVYDCGGAGIEERIKEFWNPHHGGRLDLLVVSHFHWDHIKGVPNLIKASKPRVIVLPYLYPEEIDVNVSALSSMAESDFDVANFEDVKRFISSPAEFCNEHCGDGRCRIYFVHSDRDAGAASEHDDRQNTDMTGDGLKFPLDVTGTGERGVYHIGNGAVGSITGWRFRFFMPKTASFFDKFKKCLCQLGIKGDWLESSSCLDGVFAKIQEAFRAYNQKKNPNISNLVCVHWPYVVNGNRCAWVAWAGGGLGECQRCYCPMLYCGFDGRKANAQVLTGDAMFDCGMQVEIEKSYKDRCFLFQIPHHGSRNGWRDWFNELPSCKLRPVTHRWNCTYNGKPFMTDRKNLMDACHITESSMSALNVRMFAWDGAGDEL